MTYLYHSRFTGDTQGGGGQMRTAQIKEEFQIREVDFLNIEVNPNSGFPTLSDWLLGWKVYFQSREVGISPRTILRVVRGVKALKSTFQEYSGELDTFVWESNFGTYMLLPYIAKHFGFRVIAYPHNLESLVTSQSSFYSKRRSPDWFDEELAALRVCDEVQVISREEQWLLRLHGIDAQYHAYQLPEALKQRTSRILNKREHSQKCHFLIFGNVWNPPTKMGTSELLNFLSISQVHELPFVVAGLGTDTMEEQFRFTNFDFRGQVDSQELEALFAKATGVIIHTVPSTGSLTKIPELLASGIPIIANENAIRTYYNLPNLRVYRNFEELETILRESSLSIESSSTETSECSSARLPIHTRKRE